MASCCGGPPECNLGKVYGIAFAKVDNKIRGRP